MKTKFKILQHDYWADDCQTPEEAMGMRGQLFINDPPYNQKLAYDTCDDNFDASEYAQLICRSFELTNYLAVSGSITWMICPERHEKMISSYMDRFFYKKLYRVIWHETFSQYNRFDLTQDYRFLLAYQVFEGDVTKNLDAIRIPSKRMQMGDKRAAGPKIPRSCLEHAKVARHQQGSSGLAPCTVTPRVA